ncbi:MAG: hypothetical protein WBP33_10590, partial [Saprospiraceae bacterium]
GLTSTDSLETDITTLQTQVETELEREIGTVVNLGLTLSGGELKVTAQDGTTLSNSNYGRVWLPSTSGGLSASVKVTASAVLRDDANANSDLGGLGFGITETAHWASDVPFFLYVVNRVNSALDGADGSSAFFISKSPCMSTTPASADDIGDTAAIPANDTQDVTLLLGDYTLANYVSLPCQVIGAFRMRWSTTTDDWTVQALGHREGVGQEQLFKAFANQWTLPVGQNGGDGTSHLSSAGTEPTWATATVYSYWVGADGIVRCKGTTRGSGNCTNGSGGQALSLALPAKIAQDPTPMFAPIGVRTTATNSSVMIGSFSNGATTITIHTDSTSALANSAFSDAGDDLSWDFTYKAFT